MKQAAKVLRYNKQDLVFLECDMQTRLGSMIHKFPVTVHNAKRMAQVSKVLQIPLISTRQVPRIFGDVHEDIKAEHHEGVRSFDKTLYSMLTEEVRNSLKELNKKQVILYGIETHVCVTQTCMDLLEIEGLDVTLLVDGVSSCNVNDRNVALERLRSMGANLTTF